MRCGLDHTLEELDGLGVGSQSNDSLLVLSTAAGGISTGALDLALHTDSVDLGNLNAVGAQGKALVVTAEVAENVIKSGRNIPGCQVTFANLLNVYDIVNANKLVVDKAALQKIEEVFA